ncbi:sensor histidine kinase [Streptomyces bathyalis]|uniref:sensor histidine kinase n=1 Tax=Streptomyces bathyalis TaxID=2710756 RepID=UPI001FE988F5|nr:histidine kinase [Streptomyces bathyalis]
MRRTAGDWIADLSLFLFAACFAVLSAETVLLGERLSPALLLADQTAGALACAALFLRRRWPVQLAVVLLVTGMFSHFITGPAIVAVFTVAARRPLRTTAWTAALCFVPVPAFLAGGPDLDDPATGSAITYFVLMAGTVGWGLFVRSRRQLVESLRERADRARTEARRQAREDIAREMHDVLAHRLSLLSVHAGALAFNPGASAEETRRAAGVIRDTAHEALEDLREIIGVLRASTGQESRPQPVLTDLVPLVEESREAGMHVRLDMDVAVEDGGRGGGERRGGERGGGERPDGERGDGAAVAPAAVGRTAYRIVQEGLTNARKHAPGSPVTVTVTGGPGEGLTVRLRNPVEAQPVEAEPDDAEREFAHGDVRPARPVTDVPGAGQGLVGLAERTRITGGQLEHALSGGEFELRAWIPWGARRGPLEALMPAPGSEPT